MNRWLGECDSTHNLCRDMVVNLGHHAALPTRLIDVDLRRMVLCEEEHLPATTRYVTLSHCWGQKPIQGLRLGNIDALKQCIDLSALPRTFEDAFWVTRSLGIRYIWIDNLCIIQDSHEDWQRESTLMCQVYENAYACIAATMAEDSSQGLFSARSPGNTGYDSHLVFYAAWKSQDPTEWIIHNINTHEQNVGDSVLCRRGWVLQERILSRRVIHFAEKQLFWECPSLKACESLPEGLEVVNLHSSYKQKPFISGQGLKDDQWYFIVRDYMNAKLTYPSKDTAVAIAGVAQRSGPASEYWAGLWTVDMLEHLCWRKWPRRWEDLQRSECGAPTWSWMSVIGSVEPGRNYKIVGVHGRSKSLEVGRDCTLKLSRFIGGTHPYEDFRRFSFVSGVKLFLEAPLKLYATSGWRLRDLRTTRLAWCNHPMWRKYEIRMDFDLPIHLLNGISEGPLYWMFVYVSFFEGSLRGLILEESEQSFTYQRRGSLTIQIQHVESETSIKDWEDDLRVLADLVREEDTAGPTVGGIRIGRDDDSVQIPCHQVTLV